jgi:hypothetical protein
MNASKFYIPNLNRLSIVNKKIFANISVPGHLTDSKLIFSNSCNIIIPKLIEIQLYDSVEKRICNYYKGFQQETIVEIKLLDNLLNTNFVIPHFECKNFKCLSCNKIHTQDTDKCCEMKKSILEIYDCKLYKITIPKLDEINIKLEESRDEFISLHFPSLMDKIMI